MRFCGNCGVEFALKKHNMIYCSSDCCKQAANKKLVQKYHDNKLADMQRQQKRICMSCPTQLSIYNKSDVCNICKQKQQKEETEKIMALFNAK